MENMKKEQLSALQLAILVNKGKLCALRIGTEIMNKALAYPNYFWDSINPEGETIISDALDNNNCLRRKGKL